MLTNMNKIKTGWYIPIDVKESFTSFCVKNAQIAQEACAGALIFWQKLSSEIREAAILEAKGEKSEERIPVLPIQPEEKAVLMPAGDFERLFVAMVKAKPALLRKLIAGVMDRAAADESVASPPVVKKSRTRNPRHPVK